MWDEAKKPRPTPRKSRKGPEEKGGSLYEKDSISSKDGKIP